MEKLHSMVHFMLCNFPSSTLAETQQLSWSFWDDSKSRARIIAWVMLHEQTTLYRPLHSLLIAANHHFGHVSIRRTRGRTDTLCGR